MLVILILYFFLNARAAGWVTIGIPTSFLAALGVLYLYGGSVNMISLFALIMTLGIIVDDAIVVGEDAVTHFERGEDPLSAAEGGARRMLAPVVSSSLTTIAAFMPLLLIGGIIGSIVMLSALFALRVTGFAVSTVMRAAGTTATALTVDHVGWCGTPTRRMSAML